MICIDYFTTMCMRAIIINLHSSSLPERDQTIEGTVRSDIELRRVILRLFANPAKGLSRCLPGFVGNPPSQPEKNRAHVYKSANYSLNKIALAKRKVCVSPHARGPARGREYRSVGLQASRVVITSAELNIRED